jgi:hypothetical protein
MLGYVLTTVISGVLCMILDMHFKVTSPMFYWFIGSTTGIIAVSFLYNAFRLK